MGSKAHHSGYRVGLSFHCAFCGAWNEVHSGRLFPIDFGPHKGHVVAECEGCEVRALVAYMDSKGDGDDSFIEAVYQRNFSFNWMSTAAIHQFHGQHWPTLAIHRVERLIPCVEGWGDLLWPAD